jgi:RNA polymerase sigma factor (sigma-70 family)
MAGELSRTTTDLLEALHDAHDEAAWAHFDRRYCPILIGFARQLGCGDADAADVAQETITRFVSEYRAGRYARERGRLRSWLLSIARHRVGDLRRRAVRKPASPAGTAVADLEDEAALTRLWEAEQRTAMLREALTRLRAGRTTERTVEAFEMLVLRSMRPEDVADALGISRHDVYVAKNRVADRLRTILAELETVYAEPGPES